MDSNEEKTPEVTIPEIKKRKIDYRKVAFVAALVLIAAGATIVFFVSKKAKTEKFETGNLGNVSESQTTEAPPLFSSDVSSWNNYFWRNKVNTKYPANWQIEELKKDDEIVGLKIIPPTNNEEDNIFIGGEGMSCLLAKKYNQNKCLRDKIQIPFYTNSQNEEVRSAFDLIFNNTIITEESK